MRRSISARSSAISASWSFGIFDAGGAQAVPAGAPFVDQRGTYKVIGYKAAVETYVIGTGRYVHPRMLSEGIAIQSQPSIRLRPSSSTGTNPNSTDTCAPGYVRVNPIQPPKEPLTASCKPPPKPSCMPVKVPALSDPVYLSSCTGGTPPHWTKSRTFTLRFILTLSSLPMVGGTSSATASAAPGHSRQAGSRPCGYINTC